MVNPLDIIRLETPRYEINQKPRLLLSLDSVFIRVIVSFCHTQKLCIWYSDSLKLTTLA